MILSGVCPASKRWRPHERRTTASTTCETGGRRFLPRHVPALRCHRADHGLDEHVFRVGRKATIDAFWCGRLFNCAQRRRYVAADESTRYTVLHAVIGNRPALLRLGPPRAWATPPAGPTLEAVALFVATVFSNTPATLRLVNLRGAFRSLSDRRSDRGLPCRGTGRRHRCVRSWLYQGRSCRTP